VHFISDLYNIVASDRAMGVAMQKEKICPELLGTSNLSPMHGCVTYSRAVMFVGNIPSVQDIPVKENKKND
jgi:hypothetical protein